MASTPEIQTFQWDDDNESKIAAHGLFADSVDQILESDAAIFRNRKSGSAPFQMVGVDSGGAFITVIIDPVVGHPRMWRPRTAWKSKSSEIAKARRAGVKP